MILKWVFAFWWLSVWTNAVASPTAAAPVPGGTDAVVWTLQDVERIAFDNNPDLKSARANLEATSYTVGQAFSEYLPHISVSANFQQTTLPSPSIDINDYAGTPQPYGQIIISARQILFDFGRALSEIDAASSRTKSAEQQALAVKNALQLAVEQAFYGVLQAEKLVEVAVEGVKQFEETRRRTEVLVKTGARPPFDLTQARVEYARAQLALINAKNAQDLAKITLLNLMGQTRQFYFKLVDLPRLNPVQSTELNLVSLTEKALDKRPEMKGREYALEASRYEMHSEVRSFFPKLELEGWYGDYLPNYSPRLRNAWGAGVGLTWPVFEGLRTSSRVGELSARVSESEAKLAKERQRIVADVAAAYMTLVRSESNLQVSEEALGSARENLGYARKRYNASVATILELLVAGTSQISADSMFVQARYKHELAIANLERVVNAPLVGN